MQVLAINLFNYGFDYFEYYIINWFVRFNSNFECFNRVEYFDLSGYFIGPLDSKFKTMEKCCFKLDSEFKFNHFENRLYFKAKAKHYSKLDAELGFNYFVKNLHSKATTINWFNLYSESNLHQFDN